MAKLMIGLCILALVFICSTRAYSTEEEDAAWEDYKQKFHKTYKSNEEHDLRKKIFIENHRSILNYNTKTSKPTFFQGINDLSDLTGEEINQTRNGFRIDNATLEELERQPLNGLLETLLVSLNNTLSSQVQNVTNKAWYDNFIGPASLDYRSSGRVSKVKDQGSCGSCWSFATVGALESILASRGKEVLLSEQNLVDCSRTYGNHGCNGGLMDAALRYIRDNGIMSSADYPYTAKDESCKFQRSKSVTSVRGSVVLPRSNEALLRYVLAMTGPIPVAIDAGGRSFHNYKSGVYHDTSCHSSPERLNHAVLLVGYGNEAGLDYWLIKNSWGNKWGDLGYIKMARNHRNMCGIATFAVLPVP